MHKDHREMKFRSLKAQFTIAKYCNQFLRGLKCKNENCYYLHVEEKKYEFDFRSEAESALQHENKQMALKLVEM